jgi:iron-sulfur cluster repair protein YtfE (RIC family)
MYDLEAHMTDEQVYEFIKVRWEREKTWDQIATELQKAGYKSHRTRRPLTAGACRTIYYNFNKKPAMPKADLKAKVEALRMVLAVKGDAEQKLKMIQQMLDSLES